jgi:hypothetical protein
MPTNSKSTKYGNDLYWCYIDEGWDHREVAVWKGPDGKEEIIAHAKDKYHAKAIIDALLVYKNPKEDAFGPHEIAFLEFVLAQCPEPYSTMAGNAIIWNDVDAYNNLKSKFPLIY